MVWSAKCYTSKVCNFTAPRPANSTVGTLQIANHPVCVPTSTRRGESKRENMDANIHDDTFPTSEAPRCSGIGLPRDIGSRRNVAEGG